MSLPAAYDAYTPMVPSPLNPSAPPRRRRLHHYRGRIPMSPSEKLLRRKAAEAWRSETMHKQVAQQKRGETRADKFKTVESRLPCPPDATSGAQHAKLGRPQQTPAAEDNHAGELCATEGGGTWSYSYLLRFPDLSFLAPRRLVKSIGFWRVFSPPWKLQDLLRSSRTSVM
ncbi:hypothetical protein ACRE_089180 [Hapsidospora chrysogenum ATCC 11550]|uniref:Uncharacterized protein n=1 Tax=Hapsidospora chrysogenum (strain ATCC 11550 / CBS 779.69 / DSM 880 / IAM 14645 / JCM 23072 / IMI 49137) TaxID=857340 RepID=A0A086STI7_HAPC1|nr:hypothetical protein ACRE_089180 [Hapsidospora chrysogenum ATCC 11550]